MRRGTELHARLCDRRLYEREIDRLHEKHLFTKTLYEIEQEKVTLARVIQRKSQFAKLLARTVARGEYRFAPGQVREIEVGGKVRTVVSYRLTDMIVTAAVSSIIEEAMTPLLSERLYSYRPGVSWLTPSADFAAYVRAHRRERADPRLRGLYVLRRDIDSYTDSIPVAPSSHVWQMVRNLVDPERIGIADEDWRLVEYTIRPELRELDGGYVVRVRGVPTGQQISCVLFNLYLNGLDHALAAIPGGFYARYSDDILFAHPDSEVAQEMSARIDGQVAALGLGLKHDKGSNLYLTPAARPSPDWDDTRGTANVPFIGTWVSATGTVALSRPKLRRVLRELERRALRAATAARSTGLAATGRSVCSVVNEALSPAPSPLQQASASLLGRAVTDRSQLAQIDYWVARMIVRAVTGDRGVKAFRRVSYRTVREEWGLRSLVHARNSHA